MCVKSKPLKYLFLVAHVCRSLNIFHNSNEENCMHQHVTGKASTSFHKFNKLIRSKLKGPKAVQAPVIIKNPSSYSIFRNIRTGNIWCHVKPQPFTHPLHSIEVSAILLEHITRSVLLHYCKARVLHDS